MEEIYKPEDKEADKVELYNRENNDILGDMPNWLIHTGSHIIYGLIGLLIIFAALFSYPDTVKTGVTIDDLSKTAWITVGGILPHKRDKVPEPFSVRPHHG